VNGQSLPSSDHVARYCKPTTVDHGQIQAPAFLLRRDLGETYLSVNWLEHLGAARELQINTLQAVFATKFARVSAAAEFAVLNAGAIRAHITSECAMCPAIDVCHEPEPADASHTGIFGIVADDQLVAELLVEIIVERHAAKGARGARK
jgi:hypothetical protein